MVKIWVDDIRNAPDDTWIVCRTIGASIRAIHQFGAEITKISLDHDISHQVALGDLSRPYPCEETFSVVAHYLGLLWAFYNARIDAGEAAPLWCPTVIIHSANPVGAKSMQDILKLYDMKPLIAPMGAANRLELEV
jgi:NAD+-processing family protein with receiver domain